MGHPQCSELLDHELLHVMRPSDCDNWKLSLSLHVVVAIHIGILAILVEASPAVAQRPFPRLSVLETRILSWKSGAGSAFEFSAV